ncbi:MAG TPA: hypothetical protein DDX39_12330 [Bacteroidales bacterium]|nr:MAG: hypothetical protein A2W98_11735 [Bacteroidetes bacterium GWF2_33_38]OFY76370.1 MAG: hypothetical protein A2265_02020 [Bacteroidetes bacterium RIFOXYA12_FULL_33_9]HBF89420.1 hypothetical protein [Bacteroidales bacterium]
MKILFSTFAFLFIAAYSFSQVKSNLRQKEIIVLTDTITIDTLSIVPKTFFIFTKDNQLVSDSLYSIDYAKSSLILSENLQKIHSKLTLRYRVFDFYFAKIYSAKEKNPLIHNNFDEKYFSYKYKSKNEKNILDKEQLNKSGSISRGVSFGNNQDVIVNSNLNLQLAGKLSDDINILAAISDNNIPIQPDGSTQQLQDFDKVYITLFNEKYRLTAGDFEITKPKGYFLNTYKKVQGLIVSSTSEIGKKHDITIASSLSGAVSKGKYCNKSIQAVEGNQGPYKLNGCENETYIIILSGTEKVYIDGKLIKRGEEFDYAIDYNAAEITFTPNQPITKDKRIVIEFEYSDKNYARFTLFNSNEIKSKTGNYWLNIFSESDSKNQSLQQELSDEQKILLSNIGDSTNLALVPNIDSVAFSSDLILYKKIDTLVFETTYNNVYVYSTNPDSAFYKLGFSYVGKGKGDYVQDITTTNGKVYKWVSPYNGFQQGDYMPIVLLITPKKKQMMSIGGVEQIGKNTFSKFEFSLSNNDVNTFSASNSSDDNGYGLFVELLQKIPLSDSDKVVLNSSANYRFIQKNFSPIERFNNIEFERDWNLGQSNSQINEHLLNFNLDFIDKKRGRASYDFDYMMREQYFNGINNRLKGNYKNKGFEILVNGSFLNSSTQLNTTNFLRHSASLSKTIKGITLGIREEAENNQWFNKVNDTLLNNSFSFQVLEAFLQTADSSENHFFVSYRNRKDNLPNQNELMYNSLGEDIKFGVVLNKNKFHTLKITSNYRKLTLKDSLQSSLKPESSITARIEDNFKLLKGSISSTTFYEIGSGLEIKKEYVFVEVAAGQGVYSWTDYNGNGIKEIDEFDIAVFQDQANFIRVYTPTNEMIKIFSTQLNQILNINPIKAWNNKTGIRKFFTRFSDQFAYRINRKTTFDDFFKNINPFFLSVDTMVVSTGISLRNTFSFNRTNSKYGIDFITQNNKNRILMINGLETRTYYINGLRLRWNISSKLTLIDYLNQGQKTYDSEFLSSKNYFLDITSNEASLNFQPDVNVRLSFLHKFIQKINAETAEQSVSNNVGFEIKHNNFSKANVSLSFNYINIGYNSTTNTSLAYEMLEGLAPGNNLTWTVGYQKVLANNLQLILNYNGRKSKDTKVIHSGGMQLRAFF